MVGACCNRLIRAVLMIHRGLCWVIDWRIKVYPCGPTFLYIKQGLQGPFLNGRVSVVNAEGIFFFFFKDSNLEL